MELDYDPGDLDGIIHDIEESIKRTEDVTIEKVRSFYKEFLGGTHGELTIVGDFDAEPALAKVKSMLADWKSDIEYVRVKRPAPTGRSP